MSLKSKIKRFVPNLLWEGVKRERQYCHIRPTLRLIDKQRIKRLDNIRQKIQRGERVRVAFLQMYASDIQNLCIFEKMLTSEEFDPYIIVNPDVMRSKENLETVMSRAYNEAVAKYGEGRVLMGYDLINQIATDYTEQFDMAFTNNPYDHMAHDYFKIEFWARKGIPVLYIPYFYMGRCFVSIGNLKMKSFNYLWKVFVENEYVRKLAKKYEALRGKNVVVSGYPKFDNYPSILKTDNGRKCVIIAPHHSIGDGDTKIGGFLLYADKLLELPKKYPEVDFVFRPHPLLFEVLKYYWTKEKIESWRISLLMNENVTYSTAGDYLDLFKNSDGLIHDCGSYMAEYFYTGHPCAYLNKDDVNYKKTFTKFGLKCKSLHYLIKDDSDLDFFINDVVINGNDTLKKEREKFAIENVIVNYPYVTDFIFNHILESIHR